MAMMQINNVEAAFVFPDKTVIRCEFYADVLIESGVLSDYTSKEIVDLAIMDCEALKKKVDSGGQPTEIDIIDEEFIEYVDY